MGAGRGRAAASPAGYPQAAMTRGARPEQRQDAASGALIDPRELEDGGEDLMKTVLIVGVVVVMGAMASIAREAAWAEPMASTGLPGTDRALALPGEIAVDDRYLVPELPATVVERMPAAERDGDQYLTERIALAELVIGERILAAEDLANAYAHDLPGFAAVLLVDGFRQDAGGAWFYDRYSSWLRFPLNR